jgi:hypothetical protein
MRRVFSTDSLYLRLERGRRRRFSATAGMTVLRLHIELHDPIDYPQEFCRGAANSIGPCRKAGPNTLQADQLSFAWQKRNAHSGCHAAEPLATLRNGVFR